MDTSLSIYDFIDNGVLNVPAAFKVWPSAVLRIADRDDLIRIEGLEEVGALHLHSLRNLTSLGSLRVIKGPLNCVDCGKLADLGKVTDIHGNADLRDTAIFQVPAAVRMHPGSRPARIFPAVKGTPWTFPPR